MLALATPPLIALALAALGLAAMLAVPLRRPPPFASIGEGAKRLDMTDMPALAWLSARDGASLAYRLYPAEGNRIAILVHGSSALSDEMNGMAKAFAAAGVTAVAPDIRGHGASGARGDIGYPGQLEHDLADLVAHLQASRPGARFVLVGHSLGAGFAARISATPLGKAFERFVLVAPFLGPRAPTSGPGNRAWASADVPRIVALDILRRLRLPFGEALPVIAFAIDPAAAAYLSPIYSFRLLADFGPDFDWRKTKATLAAAARRIAVVAAGRDDLMDAAAMERELKPLGVEVTVLPGVDHMQTCVEPHALAAIVEAAKAA